MSKIRILLFATLVLGVLLLSGATAADKVQSTTDDKGTIHIGTVPPADPKKAGEEKSQDKPFEVAREPGIEVPDALDSKNTNPQARRQYFGQASSTRRQAQKEELQQFRPNQPATVVVPQAQPESMPPAATPAPSPPPK
jgi:hypothetical protein